MIVWQISLVMRAPAAVAIQERAADPCTANTSTLLIHGLPRGRFVSPGINSKVLFARLSSFLLVIWVPNGAQLLIRTAGSRRHDIHRKSELRSRLDVEYAVAHHKAMLEHCGDGIRCHWSDRSVFLVKGSKAAQAFSLIALLWGRSSHLSFFTFT